MKRMYVIPLCILFLGACSANITGTAGESPDWAKPQSPYLDQELSGKIFGQNWKGKTALLRPFGGSADQLSLEVYQDMSGSTCKTPFTSTPYASVVLPANYETREYNLDISSGTPLVFSGASNTSKNVFADSARLKINEISETGFNASLAAKAIEDDGTVSEINGRIQVLDCRKQVDFSVWEEFAGWFYLTELDGKAANRQNINARMYNNSFYDRNKKSYIRHFEIPLIFSASGNITGSYSFGPLENFGSTKLEKTSNGKVLTYSYHGPITYEGTDITLNLDMTVTSVGSTLQVAYTLEVPKHITKKTHTFKLTK